MKSRSRLLATSLIVCLSIGIFAIAGFLQAAESEKKIQEGKKSIMEGAKQIMDGNKMVMDIMAKKGMKDAEFTAAEKMMADGYNMVSKGESMTTGNTMPEGKAMVTRGAKMMLDAHKATTAAVAKMGPEIVTVCSLGFGTCTTGEEQIKKGALRWFFGGDY